MTAINLLPWRERHRQYKNRQFTVALILSFVLSILGMAAVWGYLFQSERDLILANQYLIENNTVLEASLQRSQLVRKRRETTLTQLNQVEQLAHHQTALIQLWSDLASAIPSPLYLTHFSREQTLFVLRGNTIESGQVSKLASYLQQTKFLQQAQIRLIKSADLGSHSVPYQRANIQGAANHTRTTNPNRYLQFEIVATMPEVEVEKTDSAQVAIEPSSKHEAGQ